MSNIFDFANFINEETQAFFDEYLGPNWKLHVEQELKARDPQGYVFLDEYPASEQEERAKIVAEMVSKLEPDIFFGQNIASKGFTLAALYNWKPDFRVRDDLKKNPDAKIERMPNGQILRVGNRSLPHDTIEQRRASWKKSEAEILSSPIVCSNCAPHPPKPEPLRRQNACLPYYAGESYQFRCADCNKKINMPLAFSTDPCYYSRFYLDLLRTQK